MMELEAMLRGDPEEWNGLLVYPVRMRDYPLLLMAQESITASQQSFPAPWCTVRYLDALYGMEGMFPRLCLMLGLAFGLPVREERLPLYPEVKGDNLLSLRVVQGERTGTITPPEFWGAADGHCPAERAGSARRDAERRSTGGAERLKRQRSTPAEVQL